MLRVTLASLVLGMGTAAIAHSPSIAWPFRATVTDLSGRPVAFQRVRVRRWPHHPGRTAVGDAHDSPTCD